jgi:hypothetical protein
VIKDGLYKGNTGSSSRFEVELCDRTDFSRETILSLGTMWHRRSSPFPVYLQKSRWQLIHINVYHSAKLHSRPAKKQSMLSSLAQKAKAIGDQDCLRSDLNALERTFRENSYSTKQIRWGLNPPQQHVRSPSTLRYTTPSTLHQDDVYA